VKRIRFSLAALALALLGIGLLSGCGASLTPVSGTVTLDGQPVDHATVSFIPEDATVTNGEASGGTDASGNFTLVTRGSPGAYPGTYKVVVTRPSNIVEGVSVNPKDMATKGSDYLKAMEKNLKENATAGKPGPPKGGIPKDAVNAPKGGSSSAKSGGLPSVYASPSDTPLKGIKIPSDGPIKLELKSN